MQGVDGPPQPPPEFLAEFSSVLRQVRSHADYTEPADEVDLLTPTKIYEQCMACLHKHQLVVILQLHPKELLTHAECRSKQMLNPDRVHHVALWMWTDEASMKDVENRSLFMCEAGRLSCDSLLPQYTSQPQDGVQVRK